MKTHTLCPTTPRFDGDIVGCGSSNVTGADEEGFHDSKNCGMFFKKEAPIHESGGQHIEWTDEDSFMADAQGWDIFSSEGGEIEELQLQRVDERATFTTDDEAIAFVKRKAAEGDSLANKAIAYLIQQGSSDVQTFGLMNVKRG